MAGGYDSQYFVSSRMNLVGKGVHTVNNGYGRFYLF